MSNTLDLFKAMLEVDSLDEVDEEYLRQTIDKFEAELRGRERAKKFEAIQEFKEAFNKLRAKDITPSIEVHCYDSPCLAEKIPIFEFNEFYFDD